MYCILTTTKFHSLIMPVSQYLLSLNVTFRCDVASSHLGSNTHPTQLFLISTFPPDCCILLCPLVATHWSLLHVVKLFLSTRSFIPCFHTSCRVSSFEFGLGTHDFQQNCSTKVVWHTALQNKSCKNNPFSCRKHNNTFYYFWITCFCTYLRTYLFLYKK